MCPASLILWGSSFITVMCKNSCGTYCPQTLVAYWSVNYAFWNWNCCTLLGGGWVSL